VLHWLVPAHRQVRVAGPVERVGEDEADQYWSTRAPAVRLSAAALRQSRVVASRTVLETQVQDILRRHPDGADVPRPRRWGGFRVLPSRVEFWQESPDGIHDRIRYRQGGSGCRRNDPAASAMRRSSPSNRPARHLPSQSDKREATRCAGKCSLPSMSSPPVEEPAAWLAQIIQFRLARPLVQGAPLVGKTFGSPERAAAPPFNDDPWQD
jgi:hypothetical protein